MKPTLKEIQDASKKHCNQMDSDSGRKIARMAGFKLGVDWAISQMQPEWVSINTKSDLPKESCKAWVFDKPSQTIICGSFRPIKEDYNYWLANASHYMIIEEPQPPTK